MFQYWLARSLVCESSEIVEHVDSINETDFKMRFCIESIQCLSLSFVYSLNNGVYDLYDM